MPAIVTNSFRSDVARNFIADLGGSGANTYYLFIGRTEAWPNNDLAPAPADNHYETQQQAWQNMIAMKKILAADVVAGVPIHNWQTNVTYAEYDDREGRIDEQNYYVVTENENVYICLKSDGASTVNPDTQAIDTAGTITLGDGYIWKYLFTITSDNAARFKTVNFLPVLHIATDPGAGGDLALRNQWAVQQGAVDGAVHNIKVINGGTGYATAPTISVSGDGTGLTATATVDSGAVTGITITNVGSGYSHCAITFSGGGGTGASARAVISPPGGFGADARTDLRAHHSILNISLRPNDGAGDFLTGVAYRQIGLIKNPLDVGTTTIASDETLRVWKSLTIAPNSTWTVGKTFTGSSSNAVGIIDHYTEDAGNTAGTLYYHQNESTGFTAFTTSDSVRHADSSNTARTVSALNGSEAESDAGSIIYLENRIAITRAADQAETIQLVIEF